MALLTLAAALTVCTAPPPASASQAPAPPRAANGPNALIQSMRTNRVLDSTAKFEQPPTDATRKTRFQWQFNFAGRKEIGGETYSLYQLKNARTHWCLDSHFDSGKGIHLGPGVYMHKCNGNDFQKWALLRYDDCTKSYDWDCYGIANPKTLQLVRDHKGKMVLDTQEFHLRVIGVE